MIIHQIKFPIYGIIIFLSIIIGMIYIYHSLKKNHYQDKNILLYFLMYVTFSIIIGKIYTMITSSEQNNIITAGLSSYGGLIGVMLSAFIFEKILPLNNQLIKYSILSLPLVYSLSKIACFLVGCCNGIPYSGFGYVIYKEGLNIPQFPIQIVETIIFFGVFLICNIYREKKNIIFWTIISSASIKFLLDYLRYDHLDKMITNNQIFSIIIIIIAGVVFSFHNLKNHI